MNRAFQIILAAESISALGSQITIVALPITAVLLLHATPLQMGLLSGSEALPGVLFGLFAGVAIDKLPKRRVMILANLTSALVLGIVPASHALKLLSIFLLGGVNFVATGVANAEGIALMSYLPAIVESDRLAAANGQFSAARSITQIAGPALAGLLVAALSAPGAIAFDALTFLIAVLLIFALPMTDAPATLPTVPVSTLGQLKVGFQFVYESTSIRRVVLIAAFLNFFGSGFAALKTLFIVKQLWVKPDWYGAAIATAAAPRAIKSRSAEPPTIASNPRAGRGRWSW